MTSSFSSRHRAALVVLLVLAVTSIGAASFGEFGLSVAAVSLLLAAMCLVLLDMRRRQQASVRASARIQSSLRSIDEQVGELRRHLDVVEKSAGTLHEAVVQTREEVAVAHDLLRDLDHEPITEVQALLQLVPKVPGVPPLPSIGGWALTAASLLEIWHIVETRRPLTILECGSGTSTLWLAYAARAVEGARVIALDHDKRYAAATRRLIDRHGLSDYAQVRHAPLRPVTVGGEEFSWFDMEQLRDLEAVDLLLVDGPPKWTGRLARFPAVPVLRDRLTHDAVVLADDAHRPEEKEAIRRWHRDYGLGAPEPVGRDLVMLRCY